MQSAVVQVEAAGVKLAAGRYSARWHGLSGGGEAVASGVYFASLRARPDEARQSIVLIT